MIDNIGVHSLDELADRVHEANKNWWINIDTGVTIERNIGELLMLCVSELAEALEGNRKGLIDDKLPKRDMFDVEIVDCIIRLLDIAGAMIPDFGDIFEEKMKFNAIREDHRIESRKRLGGKKY